MRKLGWVCDIRAVTFVAPRSKPNMLRMRRTGRLSLTMGALPVLAGLIVVAVGARAQTAGVRGRTFETASIQARGDNALPLPVCGGQSGLRIDSGRLTATNTTLYAIITWAYGIRYTCFEVGDQGFLSGGPKWVLADGFDLPARIPLGVPNHTAQQLQIREMQRDGRPETHRDLARAGAEQPDPRVSPGE